MTYVSTVCGRGLSITSGRDDVATTDKLGGCGLNFLKCLVNNGSKSRLFILEFYWRFDGFASTVGDAVQQRSLFVRNLRDGIK